MCPSADVQEFATGPGFFKVEQDRAIALVDDAVPPRRSTPSAPSAQLEEARAELERVEAGDSDADRWQLEQRIRHAENQLGLWVAHKPLLGSPYLDGFDRQLGDQVKKRLKSPERLPLRPL